MQKIKTAIVTGASSGIGFSLVKELCQRNFEVLAIARSEDKLEQLLPFGAEILCCDLSSPNFTDSILDKVKSLKWNTLDCLVNNAGFLVNKPFSEVSSADFDMSVQVNFKAPFFLTQKLLPYLSGGQVVNISTMGGINGTAKFPGLSAYSSSKGGVGILTELLAEELQDKNIKVNALALGAVDTPMLRQAFPGYQAPKTAEEMGYFIADFIEKGSAFYNGKVLPISSTTP
ncbi:MAG: 3-oxoacyl-[acyl-carrier protein] reductase [Sphingobacteriales bacterium]|jgi:3-oxoacyl-[acyl-carrier protein] reductase